jgi:PadR family transcriptional regulator
LLEALMERPRSWHYGYELSKQTELKSGTLYPVLMRLAEQGMLEADWREPEREGRPPRHVYRLTSKGLAWARQQTAEQSPGTAGAVQTAKAQA